MQVGDLVNFVSGFFGGEERYASPGIILAEVGTSMPGFGNRRYRVLWADLRITTEHDGYLGLISAVPKKS